VPELEARGARARLHRPPRPEEGEQASEADGVQVVCYFYCNDVLSMLRPEESEQASEADGAATRMYFFESLIKLQLKFKFILIFL